MLNTDAEVQTAGSSNICEVSIEKIKPNPNQPRRDFDDDSMQELANSIRQIGIIQPITLRDMGDDTYIIIAGTGVFTGSDGKEIEVGPKSVTIAGPGESHALRNDNDQDLVFIDLIAKNHALKIAQ